MLGSTTDGASGAIHEYSPDQYFVTLAPDSAYGISNRNSRKIKELVVGFGDQIRKQIDTGSGEELNALLNLLSSDQESWNNTVAVLRNLSRKSADNFEFANRIISFYELK